jgi:hypothetical protein
MPVFTEFTYPVEKRGRRIMSRRNILTASFVTFFVFWFVYSVSSQEPGLIARWPLDETAGDIAHDEIAGNDGAFVGGDLEWVQAKFGNGLQFDGTGKYVAIPKAPELEPASSLTFSMWVNFSSLAANRQDIFCYADSYQILKMGGVFWGGIHQGGGWLNPKSVTPIETDKWYFVAETYDSKDVKLYINGELDGTIAAPGQIDYLENVEFWLGGAAGDIDQPFWFSGILDEVEIWSGAMTEDEIMELYQSQPPSSAVSSEGKLATAWGDLRVR